MAVPRALRHLPDIWRPSLLEYGPEFEALTNHSAVAPLLDDNDSSSNPAYEGRTLVNATGPADICVLWNNQVWHRGGGRNLSAGRVRWAIQTPFARRFTAQRFYPFIEYHLPAGILARSTPRRKRLLGMHALGAYG